ncbi:Hsp20/alpha crystallin family protein [Dissulfurirhabdus thermomarina]|uniref:Hsp20/alpha crystallin family protein n=1 Tax=Dissulfurirhabdus thermomarina TaxID=1765737 RepID=A0A6N9TPM6_DISTH|nr:Hsp20/alpha crystallin family protein [Dissulfurirhabdus thermomarina]NDY42053.1 Hsp20/alpha crystallin family protein [Dissulfurirhabdus thermomarina]NMX24284.1 Hsp20/alpha crystallin family protein [Dissulfurirhabdus thermomarina]
MFELAPWKPFPELSSLRREMDRLWEEFMGRSEALPALEATWAPALDVSETKDALVVKAEIPGMDPKDIKIHLAGDTLTIRGEKKQETEEKGENFHRVERRYGAFARTLRLPVEVKQDKVDAQYKKGVLKIVLPKKEAGKVKEIEVKEA